MKPIIFLAFSMPKNNSDSFLGGLKTERDQILEIFKSNKLHEHFEIIYRPYITLDQLFDIFQNPKNKNRITVFHFSGVCDENSLQLYSFNSGTIFFKYDALIELLKVQQNLKLVFINTLSSKRFANSVINETSADFAIVGVNNMTDNAAVEFSSTFYKNLVDQKKGIKESFENALKGVESNYQFQ